MAGTIAQPGTFSDQAVALPGEPGQETLMQETIPRSRDPLTGEVRSREVLTETAAKGASNRREGFRVLKASMALLVLVGAVLLTLFYASI